MSPFFYQDLVAKLPPDKTSIIFPGWIKEIKKTHRSGVEMSVLLAEMANPFLIKNKINKPIGIKKGWQSHVFVISPDAVETWINCTHLSEQMIITYLKALTIIGFLEKVPVFTDEQIKEILCSKTPQQVPTYLTHQCEWCNCLTGFLHNHHYPVPRSKGGEKTVTICPNCHSEFHLLVRIYGYKLTQKIWEACFEE